MGSGTTTMVRILRHSPPRTKGGYCCGNNEQVDKTATYNIQETARRKPVGHQTFHGYLSTTCGSPTRKLYLEAATFSTTHRICRTKRSRIYTTPSRPYHSRRELITGLYLPQSCRRRGAVPGRRQRCRPTVPSEIQDSCSLSTEPILAMITGRCRIPAPKNRLWG